VNKGNDDLKLPLHIAKQPSIHNDDNLFHKDKEHMEKLKIVTVNKGKDIVKHSDVTEEKL
jgi:hypothetical protein